MRQFLKNTRTITRRDTWQKYVELCPIRIMPHSHVALNRHMEMEKVTVYAEKYAMCTLLGNMRIMPRLHILIKPACLIRKHSGTLQLLPGLRLPAAQHHHLLASTKLYSAL